MTLLIELFDHFVFHYMLRQYQKEIRAPGQVLEDLNNNPQYQGRIRLAEARKEFLKSNNYPRRYINMIDPKATSEDEYDPSQHAWIIRRRPERSAKAEMFFRLLDMKRDEVARFDKSRKRRGRTRIFPSKPEDQQDSKFHAIADNMPIDYFDPVFFNRLQPKTRNRIAMPNIALLTDVSLSFGGGDPDERLSDALFTKKQAPSVFPLYNMVKNEDLGYESGLEWDDDMGKETDMSISSVTSTVGVEDTVESISESQRSIVTHLSSSDLLSSNAGNEAKSA